MKSPPWRFLEGNGRVALADDGRGAGQTEHARYGRGPRRRLVVSPVGRRRLVVHFQRQLIVARPEGKRARKNIILHRSKLLCK